MTTIGHRPNTLQSSRLLLQPFEITDAGQFARITNDPHVTRNLMRTSTPFTTSDARERIMRLRRKNLPVWAIDDGQLVGLIGLAGEFGLWIARHAWGNGYGSESGRLVIRYAFEQLKMPALHAHPISDNRASCRLMEKLDFQAIGRGVGFCRQRGKFVPLRRYTLENR